MRFKGNNRAIWEGRLICLKFLINMNPSSSEGSFFICINIYLYVFRSMSSLSLRDIIQAEILNTSYLITKYMSKMSLIYQAIMWRVKQKSITLRQGQSINV